jgi:hypothetical protein
MVGRARPASIPCCRLPTAKESAMAEYRLYCFVNPGIPTSPR